MQYVYPGSPLEKALNDYINYFKYTYTVDSYENVKIGNFVQYGATEYSVDISYTYRLTEANKGINKVYQIAYTLYMTKINGVYQLTEMVPYLVE